MNKYLKKIKNAQNKDELKELSYEATKDVKITKKEYDTIVSCCVWKQWQLTTPPAILDDCAKTLKLAKKYVNIIK